MEKVDYQKLPSGEEYISAPPAYVHGCEEDVERLVGDEESVSEGGCTPRRLFWASILSACCCFWPAALVGMVASIRARYADNARARKILRVGKIFVIISVAVGVVATIVLAIAHIAMMAHFMKGTYKGAMRGYVAGVDNGYGQGRSDATSLVGNGIVAKFPEHIPGSPNVFDINSRFWTEIQQADGPKEAGKLVGYAFGWVDGYKKGFCGVENADCTGVSLVSAADYVIKCEHMKAKMEKAMRKHHEAQQEGEEHDESDDEEDEKEKKMKKMMKHMRKMHHMGGHGHQKDQQEPASEETTSN